MLVWDQVFCFWCKHTYILCEHTAVSVIISVISTVGRLCTSLLANSFDIFAQKQISFSSCFTKASDNLSKKNQTLPMKMCLFPAWLSLWFPVSHTFACQRKLASEPCSYRNLYMEQSHLVALISILALSAVAKVYRFKSGRAHITIYTTCCVYTTSMKMPRHNSGNTSTEFTVLTQITHMFPLQGHPPPPPFPLPHTW